MPVVCSNHVTVDVHLTSLTIVITLQKYSPWRIIFFLNIEKDSLFGLQVELGGEGVAPSQPLDGAAVGLDVDDVTDLDPLFLKNLS